MTKRNLKRMALTTAFVANTGAVFWAASLFSEAEKPLTKQQQMINSIEQDSIYLALKNDARAFKIRENDSLQMTLYRLTDNGSEIIAPTDTDYSSSMHLMEQMQEIQKEIEQKTAPHYKELATLEQDSQAPRTGLALTVYAELLLGAYTMKLYRARRRLSAIKSKQQTPQNSA